MKESKAKLIEEFKRARDARFGKKFLPEEIASAEEVEASTKWLWIPDICYQWALGRVGYAMGRVMQIIGYEGSGKTSRIYYLHRLIHDAGGISAAVETEYAVNADHARQYLGPHWDDFNPFYNSPNSFEHGLQMLVEYMTLFEQIDPDNELPKLLTFDSIAGGSLEAFGGSNFDVTNFGAYSPKAALILRTLGNLMPRLRRSNTLLVFGNQGKKQIPAPGPAGMGRKREIDEVKGQGGRSIEFTSSYWEFVKKSKQLVGRPGFRQKTILRKNKTDQPDRAFEADIVFGEGFDFSHPTMDVLAAGKVCGVKKEKAGYFFCDEIGIPKDEKVRAKDIYDVIHSPEHIGKFLSKLDITVPENMDSIFVPKSWGDRRPEFISGDGNQIELSTVDEEEESITE